MPRTTYPIQQHKGFQYLDEGPETDMPPIVLLHGMLGDLSNWTDTIAGLTAHHHRVLVPVLPVYDLPIKESRVQGLVTYTRDFMDAQGIDRAVLVGNSLGGHVALIYALEYPASVAALILSGASGIYEVEIGSSTLRRNDRDFIRERAALTFYDPVHATDELVEEMFAIVNDRASALRLIRMARSAQTETVTDYLSQIKVPTLLVWGRNDIITPPDVAEEFLRRLPHAQLRFIDQCGHAPMIEHPDRFNEYTLAFLEEILGTPAVVSSTGTPD